MHKIYFLILASMTVFISSGSIAEPWKAIHYEMGSNKTKALYTSEATEEKEGNKIVGHVVFSDLQGQPAIVEDYTTVDGKLVKYRMQQKQVNEEGTLEVRDGRIFFAYTKEGKTKTDDEKATDNLVVPPVIVPYIQGHWDGILNGDTMSVRFGALDRKETVGFKFFKIDDPDEKVVRIKMKPTSFVIAAIVDPLIFIFDKASKKLIEIKGRTIPRQKIDGKWKDFDADSVFSS